LPTLIVILLLNLSAGTASGLLFGTSSMTRLVPPATIALGGIAMHSMVYAVFRGRGHMGVANAFQLLNNGIIPVSAFLLVPHDAATVLATTGSAWIVTSGIALLIELMSDKQGETPRYNFMDHVRLLLRFGIPRVPGEFALVGLFAIPALIRASITC